MISRSINKSNRLGRPNLSGPPQRKKLVPRERNGKRDKSSDSRALTVVDNNGGVDGEKRKKRGLITRKVRVAIEADFGKHAPTVIRMLEMDRTDGALTLLKKKLLQTSVGLLPFAERTVRESKSARGVYQFSTLVSQIREIIGDIEADRDRELLLKVIDERVIKPIMMDMAHHIVTKHFEFRKELEVSVRPDAVQDFNKKLQNLAKDLAKEMQDQYLKINEGLNKALKN